VRTWDNYAGYQKECGSVLYLGMATKTAHSDVSAKEVTTNQGYTNYTALLTLFPGLCPAFHYFAVEKVREALTT